MTRTHASYWPGRVRAAFTEELGEEATAEEGFGPLTVDVPASRWADAVELAREALDCRFFDFLSAVDEGEDGFRVVCHLAARPERRGRAGDRRTGGTEHLVLRTLVPRENPAVASIVPWFAGARWHERETHEMFGVEFLDADGQPVPLPKLLLPEEFEGHPLRKEFVLVSRVAKPFPGAKEPGESDHQVVASSRRRTRPPGVPTPDEWGPRPYGAPADAPPDAPHGEPTREVDRGRGGEGGDA